MVAGGLWMAKITKCGSPLHKPPATVKKRILMFDRLFVIKENDVENASPEARHGLILVGTQITSARQAAQWGMGAVEKVYRRLLLALPFNHIRRGLKLRNIYRLYNYCVRTCGISQIRQS
mmetsp:Transcript_17360/g.25894  ORF Transcript_17360/g.25894 Transcript_17360/m.25894 type:complete len:120 (+) Transcript_17360:597-956(+)